MSSLFQQKRSLLAVMAVFLLAVGAAAIIANGTSQSRADASTAQPVTEQFAVFSQGAAPVSPSSLSDKAQVWLETIQGNQRARLAAEASRASSDSSAAVDGSSLSALATAEGGDGITVVAALGKETICAFDEGSELGTCAAAGLAEAGGAFTAAPEGCDAYRVLGVMPDGVTSLTAKTAGSDAVKEIPVSSNVYEAILSAEETVLTSENPSVEVALPLDEYAGMNPAC